MKKIFLGLLAGLAFINAGAQKINLKFDPPAGAKYTEVADVKVVIKQKVMGQEMEINVISASTATYEVMAGSGDKGLKITYDKLRVSTEAMGNTTVMDSEDPDQSNELNQALKSMAGSSFNVFVDQKGRVTKVEGLKELSDKVNTKIKSPQAKQAIAPFLSEEGIKASVERTFFFYPETAVGAGDTYKKSLTTEQPYKLTSNNTYTVKKVEGANAVLDFTGVATTNGPQKMMANGMEMMATLDGTVSGTILADVQSGMPAEVTAHQEMKGKIEVMGQEVPMETVTDAKTTLTRK